MQRAWKLVQESGSYRFSSRLVQTTQTAPTIGNVGKTSRVESFVLEGDVDLPGRTLQMQR